jgi:galactokinase
MSYKEDRRGTMNTTKHIISNIKKGNLDERILDIYVDKDKVTYQRQRYIDAILAYEKFFGEEDEVFIYSAPGRSEIGGNHTDHQNGVVLAAAINEDAIAIVKPLEERKVIIISKGYDQITVSLDNLAMKESEKESTLALIKGVLAGTKERGYKIGGYQAYITSDVLVGAGLSSSAAYETIIGTILSGLYNESSIPPTQIAMIGQYAENVYFGKPCGLMDQMSCSVGNLTYIDFMQPGNPKVEKIELDLNAYGYSLCITNTRGSHADLTEDYAAIPEEMKKVAHFFEKDVLVKVTKKELLENMATLREKVGDRPVLRAIHFLEENERVKREVEAIKEKDIDEFLRIVKESGDSSFKYLQNIYSNHDVKRQNISIALAVSDMYLGREGVSRVHGGGFAGTIQAFVKNEMLDGYVNQMDQVFGKGSCNVLKIRKFGGIKVL